MATRGRGNAVNLAFRTKALLLATLFMAGAQAKNYNVGGANDWDYPAVADMGFYDKWAAQQTFVPGDTLTFTYGAGEHDTSIVSATEYASCRISPSAKKYTSGADVVTLTKTGTFYFYCSIMGHCEMGMKMQVTVGAAIIPPVEAPALAPALVPVKAPVAAPVLVPTPVPTLVPVPAPVPTLVPVPTPVPTPIPVLAPSPLVGVPNVAPTPSVVVVVPVPVAAPAPADSSAGFLGVGFRVPIAFVAIAIAVLFMF